jgi:CRP-like cAMP-binding protein
VPKPLFARLAAHATLSESDLEGLFASDLSQTAHERGETVIEIGAALSHVFVVVEGWAIRYRLLEDGRRQIVNVMLPGDCFDLQALINTRADHGVEAVTRVITVRARKDGFLGALHGNARLATAFWWAAVQEESILREQIVRLGRRSGRARLAHLFLELQRRLAQSGEPTGDRFVVPLTREMLADMLGLSSVHVSRSLTFLRAAGLITWNGAVLELADPDGLATLAQFDPAYLHAGGRARLE